MWDRRPTLQFSLAFPTSTVADHPHHPTSRQQVAGSICTTAWQSAHRHLISPDTCPFLNSTRPLSTVRLSQEHLIGSGWKCGAKARLNRSIRCTWASYFPVAKPGRSILLRRASLICALTVLSMAFFIFASVSRTMRLDASSNRSFMSESRRNSKFE